MMDSGYSQTFGLGRLLALVRKETLQIVRDPSTILIAFVLPVILLFLFAYAVSLDIRRIPIGIVMESDGAEAQSLAAAFASSRYFDVSIVHDRREVVSGVIATTLKGYVVIPQDFERLMRGNSDNPLVQVITDGSQSNTAGFVAAYSQGVVSNWLAGYGKSHDEAVQTRPRFWFNPELESRRFLLPGALAIIMTMIGTLLTALVIAREWERGTMEAMLSTPASVLEILIGKLLPYFVLGLSVALMAALLVVVVFHVPLRGSWFALSLLSSAFLMPALGQGLFISAIAKNQFIAAQIALLSGFLPALLLSGFLFEIDSMPVPIRILTYVIPARYFVTSLQTVFLAGDVWALLMPNMAAMLTIGAVLFTLAKFKTRKNLEA